MGKGAQKISLKYLLLLQAIFVFGPTKGPFRDSSLFFPRLSNPRVRSFLLPVLVTKTSAFWQRVKTSKQQLALCDLVVKSVFWQSSLLFFFQL